MNALPARRLRFAAVCILLLFAALMPAPRALAQGNAISDNQVNAVAEKLYCPVCENIPLDECQTLACIEWKDEIRVQLEAGEDANSVINSFVRRFGDSVVGIPQDPLLRALTLLAPIAATLSLVALGVATFRRFSRLPRRQPAADSVAAREVSDADYRRQLEADLNARR